MLARGLVEEQIVQSTRSLFLQCGGLRARSVTSGLVACPAALPARGRLPASRNDQLVVWALHDPLAEAVLGEAVLVARPGQRDPDLG